MTATTSESHRKPLNVDEAAAYLGMTPDSFVGSSTNEGFLFTRSVASCGLIPMSLTRCSPTAWCRCRNGTHDRSASQLGSIRRLPSGRYRATYRLDGAEHAAPTTFRTKTDAQVFLNGMQTDIDRGGWIDSRHGRRAVREVAEEWIASNPHKAQTSIARDRSILTTHVYPLMADTRIDRVSRSQVQHLVNGWTGASTSIERQYKCLLALFNFAVKNGWVPKNPCIDIKRPQPIPADRHLLPRTRFSVLSRHSVTGIGWRCGPSQRRAGGGARSSASEWPTSTSLNAASHSTRALPGTRTVLPSLEGPEAARRSPG